MSLRINKRSRMAVCKTCRKLVDATELTPGQGAVAVAICQGKTLHEIAAALFVSRRTIETHQTAIFKATGTRNAAELCAWAYQNGLMETLGWDKPGEQSGVGE